ncbi:peptidyl-tRNA hydrolase 2 mitochondrial precursor [Fimicolochytrium jonesii]|uniref:peptidyl-tRNA hydrolase 2 mitochondrial precursor n=1 Tax=Fimicolochytrium jonesii TaxID=1396493 RepID=UPI0022FEFCE9|nr:peptidyl-tRNA hydrolase 2 mitochondrial precursor [Fimicolochytrium jonesii]KAI8817178.1 peptidyl-tRNA hydrolase 2 mitochondrial precursor [Fimicolochytrium jonesii]
MANSRGATDDGPGYMYSPGALGLALVSMGLGLLLGLASPKRFEFGKAVQVAGDVGRSATRSYKMVLVIRSDLQMSTGKIAAQASHATLGTYKAANGNETTKRWLAEWEIAGQKKVALRVDSEEALMQLRKLAREKGLPEKLVRDAGLTQVASGSATALGIFGPDDEVNKITGELRLY